MDQLLITILSYQDKVDAFIFAYNFCLNGPRFHGANVIVQSNL